MDHTDSEKIDTMIARVVAIAETRPRKKYADCLRWQQELRDAVTDLSIARLEPTFNLALRALPQDTIDQKQALCRWANEQLRSCGLAIRCPKTGQPAILHAGPGDHPKAGRYQIEVIGSRQRTKSSNNLLPIQLVSAGQRRESLVEYWRDRASSSRKRSMEKD